MKKVFILLTLAVFAACNSSDDASQTESKKSDKDTSTARQDVTYPYEVMYSSKFEIGDAKNAQAVLKLWKDWDNGTLANSSNIFADSVEMYFADGGMISGPRDSVVAAGQQFRNSYTTVTTTVNAITPLKSTDKNEEWVSVWGMEKSTDKKGKTDSVYLQETWRFNKDGKVNLVYQFKALPATPAK